jgi:hypothetical protein
VDGSMCLALYCGVSFPHCLAIYHSWVGMCLGSGCQFIKYYVLLNMREGCRLRLCSSISNVHRKVFGFKMETRCWAKLCQKGFLIIPHILHLLFRPTRMRTDFLHPLKMIKLDASHPST